MPIWKRNLIACWFGMFASGMGLSQIAPVLPLFIQYLGVEDSATVSQLSGIAFGITFILSGIFSPIWGKAADKYGRKLMLIRASLGMSIFNFGIAFSPNVYILILLRMLVGITAGYATACTTLIATQTDREHAGFALGTLATAGIAGSLIGPTFAGFIEAFFGIREVFFFTAGLLMISFFITLIFVKETFIRPEKTSDSIKETWESIPEKSLTVSVFVTFFVMNIALFAIEPVLTVYVDELANASSYVALIAGLIFSASGLGNIIASPILGKLSDRIGVQNIILIAMTFSAIVYFFQAFVQNPWQLLALNFLLGLAAGGMRPAVNILVKKITPDFLTGRIYGVINLAGYFGITAGAFLGGQMAAWFGLRMVFYFTSSVLLLTSVWIYFKVYRKMNSLS